MLADFRFALRALLRSSVFTAVSVLMLSAGIGLSIFMFSSINAFVLKPLPFPDPDRLVHFEYTDSRATSRNLAVPALDWLDLRERQKSLQSLAAYTVGTANLGGIDGPAERLSGAWISADALSTLGVVPILGRDLAAPDQGEGAEPVAVIGFDLWQQHLNADPAVIGRSLRINGKPTRVIGVMPRDFAFPMAESLWLPLSSGRSPGPGADQIRVKTFGRLLPGVSMAQAQADFTNLMSGLAAERGEPLRGDQAKVEAFADEFILPQILGATRTMFIAVLLVLLIACANVASLVMARFSARARELSVRSALGASRGRLVRQVMSESMIIAALAGMLGYAGAEVAGQLMTQTMTAGNGFMPYWVNYSTDWHDLAFSGGIALAAALLAGLLPALRAGRVDIQSGLRQGSTGSIGDGSKLGRSLVAAEVALSVILLVCAGVAIRSALQAQEAPLGIDTGQVLSGRIAMFEADYPDAAARLRFTDDLAPRLHALPGVSAVAFASTLPLMGYERQKYARVGDEAIEDKDRPQAWSSSVSDDFFKVFGIALREGRGFDARDTASSPLVAVVSAGFAAKVWPHASALGQRVQLNPKDAQSPWLEVVGVVADSLQADYLITAATLPAHRGDGNVFRPISQNPPAIVSFALRAEGNVAALGEAVRSAVRGVDANLPVYWLQGMNQWRDKMLWGSNIIADLFGVFAVFALLLAVAGIYAVLAFDVNARTREIGVRRALGAGSRGVLGLVLKRGARQVIIGLVIGIPLALAFSRLLGAVVMPGAANDPLVYALVIAVLAAALLFAALIPARRALRVDPMEALRNE
ncbi:MAG: ABC transporter permease [Dokdonella sp.]|uniref:ABC transporter permease n=1 Tax=Dokdonella sp. TaxID=2291710 RepID=UPI003BB0175C